MCAANDLLVTVGSRIEDPDRELPAMSNGTSLAEGVAAGASSRGSVPDGAVGSLLLDDPTIYLYDKCPGGVGFSEKLFALHTELMINARDLIKKCPCQSGCPSCVGPEELVTKQGKVAAIAVMEAATAGAPSPYRH
jgi:DEAD/DEAH box helicase domain-containing protein